MPKSTFTHQLHGIATCPICGKTRQRNKEAVATWLCSKRCRDEFFKRKGWNVPAADALMGIFGLQRTTANDTLQEE